MCESNTATIEQIELNEEAVAEQVAELGEERLGVLVTTNDAEDTGEIVIDTTIDGPTGTARRLAELIGDFKAKIEAGAATN